jgi:hypothetical protein
MLARMDARRAVVVTAVIWAFWHVPLELSGIQHIDGVAPVGLALGMPLGIFATGLGAVRLQVHEGLRGAQSDLGARCGISCALRSRKPVGRVWLAVLLSGVGRGG